MNAKEFLDNKGYGSGTTYTTNLVAGLMQEYAEEINKSICLYCRTQYPKCEIRRRCKVTQCDDFLPYADKDGNDINP